MTIAELQSLPCFQGWMVLPLPQPPTPLTRREREILDAVLAGRTHKEVAFDLGVSDATVRVLYARAMKKLGRRKSPPRSQLR
jgi:DNA-binding NarL/FixJ family response regulator